MKVAITGATGFIGRYIVRDLLSRGWLTRCWRRPTSRLGSLQELSNIEWLPGDLTDESTMAPLVDGCDAVVHAAVWRPGRGFRGAEGDIPTYAQTNIVGSLRLVEAAKRAGCRRFVFVSSCAVHEVILDDRLLDETHPLWPTSHYGAYKAAVEKFVHSYGLGERFPICAVRPTGVYGIAEPIGESKWFDLVHKVVRGESVECHGGGKEVHAADVAAAIRLLLESPEDAVRGECFNCYDMYVSQYDVAQIAKSLSGSSATITGGPARPKHQIDTTKIRQVGMQFPGEKRLRETIADLVEAVR